MDGTDIDRDSPRRQREEVLDVSRRTIDPIAELGHELISIEKPSRYLGGEQGIIRKEGRDDLSIALCFPDLYEIGMSNNAIRILYSGLNAIDGVRCERVFAPAPDFENLLANRGLPLYTLESGMPLRDVDILGFSVGYELSATGILSVLKCGCITIKAKSRNDDEPIVILGGPAVSNPHPYSDFADAAFIGEAEGEFFSLARELASMKRAGASRVELLDRIGSCEAIWTPTTDGKANRIARRAIFHEFPVAAVSTVYPLPSLRIVQDHGTVEIMRGCPNGCRFCHAGFYYRPQRCKPYSLIRSEVEALVTKGGHREITLASLSSGDYPGIGDLLRALNREWAGRQVSFQLPSLKINSFTLPIVEELSRVRKSGLTFAIETPVEAWQVLINKDVSFEQTLAILGEAKRHGFKSAKFYFMIGLPIPGSARDEVSAIAELFDRIALSIDIKISINVGVFVPKPHTPFQWCAQLSEADALDAIHALRDGLRRHRNMKLSYHSPFVSLLEGIIARGDDRVGELLLRAFERGARLDAWEERFDAVLWRSVLEGARWNVLSESSSGRSIDEPLPWDDVDIRVSRRTLLREYKFSFAGERTPCCQDACSVNCGSCSKEHGIVHDTAHPEVVGVTYPSRGHIIGSILFQFTKKKGAAFIQHLALKESFERAMAIAGLPVMHSEGYNPLPRLELSPPLPLGVQSECEIGLVLLCEELSSDTFMQSLSSLLPSGIQIVCAEWFGISKSQKRHTLGSMSWGSLFSVSFQSPVLGIDFPYLLNNILSKKGIRDSIVSQARNGSIDLMLPDSKKKGDSILPILDECVETRPVLRFFNVSRSLHFACLEGVRFSFFEAYRRLYTGP
jgi:radical SAM family uncharacterized protein